MTGFENSEAFAKGLDAEDSLAGYRQKFHFPTLNGKDVVYFTGNSLGLQPKGAREAILQEFDDWAAFGVEGHFEARNPWYSYHEMFAEPAANLVGAKPAEVVLMNTLTTNLHLAMVSFYRPRGKRYKIICEGKAFPSDLYALESQARFHGYDPDDAIVELHPRDGEELLRPEDVLAKIEEVGDELALLMMGGMNYYTGQWFDLPAITSAAHKVGAFCGFDLAHAAGNMPMQLHDWDVDFAVWCSYKYLNSGPGSVSGMYVHEKHHQDPELPRFAGWWGYEKETRFEMKKGFKPMASAEAWQLSNAPIFSMAAHKVSLDLFNEAGMENLRAKSERLTAYLEFIINDISSRHEGTEFEIITPPDPKQRGSQLSILAHGQGKALFDKLTEGGVVADWREPNVIRVAPVPMYNSFEDVYRFGQILESSL